jgi:hypothetical protein
MSPKVQPDIPTTREKNRYWQQLPEKISTDDIVKAGTFPKNYFKYFALKCIHLNVD